MGEKKRRHHLKITRTPINNCPNCGSILDAASNIEGESPKEGNIAICIDCHHIMIFDAHLQLREFTEKEIVEVAGDKDVLTIMNLLKQAKEDYEKIHGKDTWIKRRRSIQ